jgi:hypothetical protein
MFPVVIAGFEGNERGFSMYDSIVVPVNWGERPELGISAKNVLYL